MRRLQRALAGRLAGTIDEAEEPDVIVIDQTRRIGVEVTELSTRTLDAVRPDNKSQSARVSCDRYFHGTQVTRK